MSAVEVIRPSCDLCRRMKIKCDRAIGGCAHCVARRSECTVSRTRRRTVKNHKRFHATTTEIRIQGDSADQEVQHGYGGDSVTTMPSKDHGSFYCIGSSSGYSLFTPKGLEWITRIAGPHSLASLMANENFCRRTTWGSFDAHMFRNLPACDREPLPSHEEMTSYVESYLDLFNCTFTLFDNTDIMEILRSAKCAHLGLDSPSYAALNIILAIGSLLVRSSRRTNSLTCLMMDPMDQSFHKSWRYFRNACSTFCDINFQDTNLLGISALVGMTFMMTLTENFQPSYILISAAGRLAQSMGLHQRLGQNLVPPLQAERRQNIFWIIYILEKGISFRCGRPSMLNDDDMVIPFPYAESNRAAGATTTPEQATLRSLAQLAFFESRVYYHIYSDKARRLPETQRQSRINFLDNKLRRWKELLPAGVRPGQPIQASNQPAMSIYILHLAYYHCLLILHQSPTLIEPLNGSDSTVLEHRSEKSSVDYYRNHSTVMCLGAARAMLRLLESIVSHPHDRLKGLLWNATSQPLPAFLVLFAQLLKDPLAPNASADLDLMATVLVHLGVSTDTGQPDSSIEALVAFKELYRVAKYHICRALSGSEFALTEGYSWPNECEDASSSRLRGETCIQINSSSTEGDIPFDEYHWNVFTNAAGQSDLQDPPLQDLAFWPFSITEIESTGVQLGAEEMATNSILSTQYMDDDQTAHAAKYSMAAQVVLDPFLSSSHENVNSVNLQSLPDSNWQDDWNL